MKIYNSTHNFYRKKLNTDSSSYNYDRFEKTEEDEEKFLHPLFEKYNKNTEISSISCVKNEEFGFLASFYVRDPSYVSVGKNYDLPWWGLSNRYRVVVESDIVNTNVNLVGYVLDDDGIEKADIIFNKKSMEYENCEVPLFISGKIPKDTDKNKSSLSIKIYHSDEYDEETLVDSANIDVEILDLILDDESSFFLDLWQHPCSWARAYELEYFSDEHFKIIENYLCEMKKLGQKVIDLVVSDFPWAGQKCFDVKTNPSRLYEYNIVEIRKKDSKYIYDFKNMDRYIDLCFKLGIKEEINIFGIIGNWHGYDFKSPVLDYMDPIRIKYYDEDRKIFDYMRTKDEVSEYIKALFDHLDERKLLEITKIIGDEPGDYEKFRSFSDFIKDSTSRELRFKYALHSSNFLREYSGDFESFSLNTLLLPDYISSGDYLSPLKENSTNMTWYPCWFPDKFNTFIKSPLIESRYIGTYTYSWKLKGMLRWSYALFVENMEYDIRYKQERWPAGDMFLVYPSKDGGIQHSLREKNLLYGIQDFNIFKQLEKNFKVLGSDISIYDDIVNNLGLSLDIEKDENNIILPEYTGYNSYIGLRNNLIKKYINNR